ncbi:unnamed protein product [Prorocentrum cordatum]|uniref:Phospholipase B-like n=1 Tax=Prorocentrum cordatum TaxID=2364126 RepID=A0ABN9U4L9_9DINO|nr:unnamed protein product [Polarella glacialis]
MPLPTSSVRHMVFTSNPGCLYSADDFYNTDAGLTVIETTITNYNASSWSLVVPQSIMTWGRAMVATRLSTSGEEWTEHFQRYSSGTCNNQWIIVDYKRFRPGERPKSGDGLLWIAEAFPGYTRRADMTSVLLSQGSWPSYNIPYFEDVRRVGGYFAMQERHPLHADDYSFERDSRARMFARAREAGDITSLDSFAHLMRYNGDHDRLENGDRCNAISARCDLNPVGHGYDCFGAIDTKVSRWRRDVTCPSWACCPPPTTAPGAARRPSPGARRPAAWTGAGRPSTWGTPTCPALVLLPGALGAAPPPRPAAGAGGRRRALVLRGPAAWRRRRAGGVGRGLPRPRRARGGRRARAVERRGVGRAGSTGQRATGRVAIRAAGRVRRAGRSHVDLRRRQAARLSEFVSMQVAAVGIASLPEQRVSSASALAADLSHAPFRGEG